MHRTEESLAAWLENDESGSRPNRAKRLQLLLEIFDTRDENALFLGGSGSYQAYMELRLAFIHGLYLATVVLALACIEQELAGSVHAQGLDKAANANFEWLLSHSLQSGQLSPALYESINQLRSVRNSYAHFRPPTHHGHAARRAVSENTPLDQLSENDAIQALRVLASFVNRSGGA